MLENGDSLIAVSYAPGSPQLIVESYETESGNLQSNNAFSLNANIKDILKTKDHHVIIDEEGTVYLLSNDKISKKDTPLSSLHVKVL